LLTAACLGGERSEPSSTTNGSVTTSSAIVSTTTTPVHVTSTLASMSPEAEAYLDEALGLMEKYSINSGRLDWRMIRDFAFRAAGTAQTPAQTHGAIIAVFPLFEDDHSIFLSPSEADDFSAGDALYIEPEVELLDGRVGYVSIGRYYGDIGAEADAYAADLSGAIGQLNSTACGWVVDLLTPSNMAVR
jgi:carboxyl-terminal processing protease